MSEAPRLKRTIGLIGAILLAFNGAVGAGIFALPSKLSISFGAFSPWLFPLVALGLVLIVWPFARSVAAFPESGGPATYGRVFGRLPGFELGWVYYVARVASFAANANVLVAYIAHWWVGADKGLIRAVMLIGITAAFVGVNVAGVRRSLGLLGGLTILKVLPLLALALAVLALTFPPPGPGAFPAFTELEAGIVIILYAFTGFENVVVPAGETERPQRTLPSAIFATVAAMTLLYFLVQLAFVSALPSGASEGAPLVDLGAWLAGRAGATIITLTAIASIAGNLHSNVTSTPRVTYAMGVRGDLPHWFGRVHPRFETPANSIAFMGLVVGTLAVSGSFVALAAVAVLSRMFVYAVTIAALPRAPERPRLTQLHWASGAIGIGVCVWAATQADVKAWLTLGALAAAGLALYVLASIGRRRA